jgi:hypothetical protein
MTTHEHPFDRRKFLNSERLSNWIAVAAFIGSALFFLNQVKELPDRVNTLDVRVTKNEQTVAVHCARQEQFEADLVRQLEKMDRKLDRILK